MRVCSLPDTSSEVDCHSDGFQRLLRKRFTFCFDTSLFCCPQLHLSTNPHTHWCKHNPTVHINTQMKIDAFTCNHTHTHFALHVNVLSLWFSQFTADINPSFTVDRPVLECVCSLVSSASRSSAVHMLIPTPRDLYSLCCR